jgi:hypothetical protein
MNTTRNTTVPLLEGGVYLCVAVQTLPSNKGAAVLRLMFISAVLLLPSCIPQVHKYHNDEIVKLCWSIGS